jgi:tetrahydromethanopterin S-methyltransferase subunit G
MSAVAEAGSFRELYSRLTSDVTDLVQKEVQLIRAETSERIGQVTAAFVALLAGSLLGLAALILLLEAAAQALADHTRLSLLASGVIVGVVVGIIAILLIWRAMSRLKAGNLLPTKSARAIRRDAQMIKEHVR